MEMSDLRIIRQPEPPANNALRTLMQPQIMSSLWNAVSNGAGGGGQPGMPPGMMNFPVEIPAPGGPSGTSFLCRLHLAFLTHRPPFQAPRIT